MRKPTQSKSSTLTVAVRCLAILTVLAVSYVAMVAKPVILPLILALLFTLVILPVHKFLCRMKLKPPVAAGISILGLAVVVISGLVFLASPAVTWAQTLDLQFAENRLRNLLRPVQEVQEEFNEVVEKVDKISADFTGTKTGKKPASPVESSPPTSPDTSTIETESSGTIEPPATQIDVNAADSVTVKVTGGEKSPVLDYVQSFGAHATFTFMLVFFFLAYGETLYRRITEGTETGTLFEALSEDISSYLLTITLINLALGVAVGIAMWLLDMPNPILWGAMATVLNYLPYLGALVGTVIVGLVALLTFTTLSGAATIPAIYYLLTLLEGGLVTPMLIGRRFSLNPIIVVLWFLAWGSVWGIAGMLIATPTLMALKIVTSSLPGYERIDRVISR
ncbi:AI-2E family transporter [Verrucomicrobiales bacterium BCK34]|nr:AI-2E family transporter [Verrucomicrobiales bacterium BCK34]